MNLEKISKLTDELIQDQYKLKHLKQDLLDINSGDYKPSSEEVVYTNKIARGSNQVSLYALENAIADFKYLLNKPKSGGYHGRLLYNPANIECEDIEDVTIEFETTSEMVEWEDYEEDVVYIHISADVKKHGKGLEQVKDELEKSIGFLEKEIKDKKLMLKGMIV